jgi:SET domain-containing protein
LPENRRSLLVRSGARAGFRVQACGARAVLNTECVHHDGSSPDRMIQKRRSRIDGWGVYATRPINKNTRIVTYDGEKITNKESLKREVGYLRNGHIWCFKLNHLYVRDAAVGGNVARFINHSCSPNCYTQVIGQTIWIRAARNIRKGEELTYDYSTDGKKTIQCRCRPGCKTRL